MEPVGRVAACWRYPVKSVQGVEVESLEVTPAGVAGDRAVGIVDASSGLLLSAKHVRQLLEAVADDERLTLPDGSVHALDDPATAAAVGGWLDRSVRLVRAGETGPISYRVTFGTKGPDRREVDVPTADGTLLDVAAVHLLSTASLAAGAAAYPDLDWDVRRFRPNVLIEVPGATTAEDGWVGRDLGVGGAVLTGDDRTLRCAMPMRAQRGLDRRPDLFPALRALNGNHLGLYCSVNAPGTVRVGDPVHVLET